jgi:thymidylate synthase
MNTLYFAESLTLGDPNSSLAICTLWTPREKAVSLVDDFFVAGQLYSVEGVSWLVRSLLANPNVRDLLVVGKSLNGSHEALRAFWNGSDNVHLEIDREILKELRKQVTFHDFVGTVKPGAVAEIVECLQRPLRSPWSLPNIFPYTLPTPDSLEASESGWCVRGTLAEAYSQILWNVMTYGKRTRTQHSSDQLELLNVTAVITSPPADSWQSWMPFSKEELGEQISFHPKIEYSGYLKKLFTPEVEEGVAYTYGSRLRNYRGIDQIVTMMDELWVTSHSRRAVSVLWDVELDIGSANPPCLVLIQGRIRDEKLYMTAYFRSHDMYRAWGLNVAGLRYLQYEMATRLAVDLGELAIHSTSAHIYEHDWDEVRKVVDQTKKLRWIRHDPRGAFTITLENATVVVRHYLDGKHVQTFAEIDQGSMEQTVAPYLSTTAHAIYLGRELCRAYRALRDGKSYTQDSKNDA